VYEFPPRPRRFDLDHVRNGCSSANLNTSPLKVSSCSTAALGRRDITFTPSRGAARGNRRTNSEGIFHLMTYNAGDGALPGDYKVTVTKMGAAREHGLGRRDPEMRQGE